MKFVREVLAAAPVALALILIGCASDEALTTQKERGTEVKYVLTWQEAKATTQAMELEIAALIPEGAVEKVSQMKKGTLLSCDKYQHTWVGATTVTVEQGTEIEPIVRAIEDHFRNGPFLTGNRSNILGSYEVSVHSPESAELYLIAEDSLTTIRISSNSACFTLPEGVYPGGLF